LDATEEKYKNNFNMYSYVNKELPELVSRYFHVDKDRTSIMGHSMGGMGALASAFKNPTQYKSVSAFAPIGNPTKGTFVGPNAYKNYLGSIEAGD
jgi:S-formylglutathione hydrolase